MYKKKNHLYDGVICALYVMEKTHVIGLLLHLVGRLVVGEEPAFGMHDNWLEEQSLAMVYPKLFILSNNHHRTVYKKWEVGEMGGGHGTWHGDDLALYGRRTLLMI